MAKNWFFFFSSWFWSFFGHCQLSLLGRWNQAGQKVNKNIMIDGYDSSAPKWETVMTVGANEKTKSKLDKNDTNCENTVIHNF